MFHVLVAMGIPGFRLSVKEVFDLHKPLLTDN